MLLPSLFLYLTVIFLLPEYTQYDSKFWYDWTVKLKADGLGSGYDGKSDINYLPVFLYILKGFGSLFSQDQIYTNIYKLKAITLLFDFATILLLCSMVKSESDKLKYFIFGVLNVGFIYNTIIWNQVDGILTFFIFSSFYFAYYNKTFLSVILFLLALNFKLQGIVFAPILIVLWLPHLKIKTALLYAIGVIVLQGLIILPFALKGNLDNLWKVVFGSVDFYPVVSLNAYNFWHLLFRDNLMVKPDNIPIILGCTYKTIGLILFCVFSLLVCVPLYLKIYKNRIYKEPASFDLRLLLISMALMCYFFFFFNTQMHERYIHPIIIFLTALAFLYNQWILWIVVSLNYALSLEGICHYLHYDKLDLTIFKPLFHARVYAIGLMMLFFNWIRALPGNAFSLKRIV